MTVRSAVTFRASSIGDCLMGKYLLEQIHATYPEARCTLVVASRVGMISDLLKAYSWLSVRSASRRDLSASLRLLLDLWGSDATVTQYSARGTFSLVSKLFARLITRPGRLVGFQDPFPFNQFILDRVVPFDAERALILHEQDALRALSLPVPLPHPTLTILPDQEVFTRFKMAPGSYVLLHLFAGTLGRSFLPERNREIVALLAKQLPSTLRLVLTAGPGDEGRAQQALAGTRAELLPKATLQELGMLMTGAHRVVSIDTGIAHMAAQLSVPLTVIRSCGARIWWSMELYGKGDIRVIENDAACKDGHTGELHKNCLNTIPLASILEAVP